MGPVTTSAVAARTALSGKEWRVLVLLVISALINYIDRTTLSVGATDIQRELGLTNTQIGLLQSGFFGVYAACQLFSVAAKEERQNFGAFLLHCQEFAGIDA